MILLTILNHLVIFVIRETVTSIIVQVKVRNTAESWAVFRGKLHKKKSDTVAYPRKKRWSKSRLGVKNIACYDADQEMLDSDPTADIMDNNSNVTFSTCDSDNSSDIDFVPWSLQISLCNFELYI